MQKQALKSLFNPIPVLSSEVLYFDADTVKLPYSETFSKLHYHDRYEIGICESGEGLFLSEGRVSYISRGDVIFIAPNNHHYSRSFTQSEPCMCRFAFIDAKEIEKLIDFLSKDRQITENILKNAKDFIPPVIHAAEAPSANTLLTELVDTCRIGNPDLVAMTELRLALFLFNARSAFKEEVRSADGDYKMDSVIMEISEYIAANYEKRDTAGDLAKMCHLSESQFRRRFIGVYGISPIAYKNQLRCSIAAELLSRTHLSVSEISARVGYNDVSDFYRAFKKNIGVSPSAYRTKLKV